MDSFLCGSCGETHQGLAFAFAAEAPLAWDQMTASERDKGSVPESDLCVIRGDPDHRVTLREWWKSRKLPAERHGYEAPVARMPIQQSAWDDYLSEQHRWHFECQPAVRRLIDNDFRTFWYVYERYELAVAEVGDVRSPYHAMGSILNRLTNWQLYALDSALRDSLIRESGHSGPWPKEVVREWFLPLRTLAEDTIKEAEAGLGPVPPLEAIPLLDLEWLGEVAAEGQEPFNPRKRFYKRATLGEVAVNFAGLSRAREYGDALRRSDQEAADRISLAISSTVRRCRAIRVLVAGRDISTSRLLGQSAELIARQADFERACIDTESAARRFLRLVRSAQSHD